MRCTVCGGNFDVPGTKITFDNPLDKYLNRTFNNVCYKCAYSLIEKMVENDPTNKRLNEPRNYDEVVKREG
jgi:hypothetical protein